MKKIDNFIRRVDRRINPRAIPGYKFFRKHFAIFSSSFLVALMILSISRLFMDRAETTANVIHEQIAAINQVLNDIDRNCNILTVRGPSTSIDFLTVEKFVGSTIGGLNLAHPQKWSGPYMQQIPVIQGKPYQIARVYEGYCIMPGNGVVLPNHEKIGEDLVITPNTPITPMIQPGGALYCDGGALAMVLTFKIGDWDSPHFEKKEIEQINQVWKEFNSALPFASLCDPLHVVQRC